MNFEVIGFIASLFVMFSFIPKDSKKIRIINCVGCVAWIIYGLLSSAPSVWVMNLLVLIIHLFHLLREQKQKIEDSAEMSKSA